MRPTAIQSRNPALDSAKMQTRYRLVRWMTNHIHLLVQVGDRPLGCLMQRIGTRFARTIQKRMRTTGHLFERRYHALLVDVDSYFLELLRYIHLNPVRARMVASPEQYPWSSHHDYLATQPRDWITTDPMAATPTVSIQTVNHDDVHVEAWAVTPGDLASFRAYLDRTYSETDPADPQWQKVMATTLRISRS